MPRWSGWWLRTGTLAALFVLVPGVGRAADDRLFPARAPILVDGTGRVLGLVYPGSTGGKVFVWMRIGERDLLLEATADTLAPAVGTGFSRLAFATPDCTGTAWFLQPGTPPRIVFTFVAPGPGQTLFAAEGPPEGVAPISSLDPSAAGACQAEPGGLLLLPRATQILDLASFPPPYAVR